MLTPYTSILRTACRDALFQASAWLQPLLFFLLVVVVFSLATDTSPEIQVRLAPGVLWVGALLSLLLSLDGLFRPDFEDGTLEQWILSPCSLAGIVWAKGIGHWLLYGVPVAFASPLLGMMLQLPLSCAPMLVLSLLLGTLTLSFLAMVGVALTVGLRQGGLLLPLILLPLYVPTLLFGTQLLQAVLWQDPIAAPLALLGAVTIATVALSPLATAAALRVSVW